MRIVSPPGGSWDSGFRSCVPRELTRERPVDGINAPCVVTIPASILDNCNQHVSSFKHLPCEGKEADITYDKSLEMLLGLGLR